MHFSSKINRQSMACIFAFMVFYVAVVGSANAQGGGQQPETVYAPNWVERLTPSADIETLDSLLLGDSIDLKSGRLSFEHVDVSLPGNSDLVVEVRRRLNPSRMQGGEFADWELAIPTISTKILENEWLTGSKWGAQRCSGNLSNAIPNASWPVVYGGSAIAPADYSDGVILDVPGRTAGALLRKTVSDSWPSISPDGHTVQKVTADGWILTCISNVDGQGTEGFYAYAPNGDRYTFDIVLDSHGRRSEFDIWRVTATTYTAEYPDGSGGTWSTNMYQFNWKEMGVYYDRLAVSEVRDVHGNWVQYEYGSNGRLVSVESNDGRRIELDGQNYLVETVTANPGSPALSSGPQERQWAYSYASENVTMYDPPVESESWAGTRTESFSALSTVTRPDGRQWSFDLAGLQAGGIPGSGNDCKQVPQTVSLTHPDGVTGTFELSEFVLRLGQGGPSEGTYCPNTTLYRHPSSQLVDVMSVTSKTLSGPSTADVEWNYNYYDTGSSGDIVTVIGRPDGSKKVLYHPTPYSWTVAREHSNITKKEVFVTSSATTPLEVTEYDYVQEPALGENFVSGALPETYRPVRSYETTITRGADWFKTRLSYVTNRASATYSYGEPTLIDEWSSVSGGWDDRRTAVMSYLHNSGKWILGLTDTVTRNGKLFDDYGYDSNGRLTTYDKFGARIATIAYHTSGNHAGKIATVSDASSNVWTYDDYKGGRPGSITLPNTDEYEIEVDDNGWVTSITNPRNLTTYYDYDPIGRLTKITPAAVDGVTTETDIAYTYSTAGLLTQTLTKASLETTTEFDGFLRPVLIKNEDTFRTGTVSYVRNEYDSFGRLTFESFPSATSVATGGVDTVYDALGRAIEISQNVAPFATTSIDYLSGNRISVTDPRQNTTVTTYESYGAPEDQGGDDARPVFIDMPIGADIVIDYDIWGNKILEQQVVGSTIFAEVEYEYNDHFLLEEITDPDSYISYTYYDAVNRPIVTIDGAGRKTRTVYDSLGRVEKVIKAWAGNDDGTGSTLACGTMRTNYDPQTGYLQQCYQSYTYTPTGKVNAIYDANGNKTKYEYDELDRQTYIYYPSKDTIGEHSTTDYELFTYDVLDNLATKRTRNGNTITYNYDALGRLLDRNVPGAPTHTVDSRTVTHSYTYDAAGRQLTAKHSAVPLSYTYDAVGRLIEKRHNGVLPISYLYDEASNLIELTYPDDSTTVAYGYDALNRVICAEEGDVTVADPCASAGRRLATITYDDLSRRQSVAYANGTTALYDFTDRGDLTCHAWNLSGTAPANCDDAGTEAAYEFSYNGVGQTLTESVSDPQLRWVPQVTETKNYVSNGLNQYESINGTALTYSGTGNLLSDVQGRTFTYDAENVMNTTTLGGATVTYRYYADGTRRLKIFGSAQSRYYYNGDQEIAEYDEGWPLSTGNMLRYYVRLPGSIDEPFLMVDYTGTGCSTTGCEVWAHQNRLGSVVMATDDTGAVLDTYTYSPFGLSGTEGDAGFPFRFTGQKLDPETGLYYYKARYYDPELGRFLQTDPIGYEDQMNLYAYVGNDPVNATDPSGERGLLSWFSDFGILFRSSGARGLREASRADPPSNIGEGISDSFALDQAMTEYQLGYVAGAMGQYADSHIDALATEVAGAAANEAISAAAIALRSSKNVAKATAAERAKALASNLSELTQSKVTIAVTETKEGVRIVSSSEGAVRPVVRAAMQPGEIAVSGKRGVHAEINGMNGAEKLGLTPTGTAASRLICPDCAPEILRRGVEPLSPLK